MKDALIIITFTLEVKSSFKTNIKQKYNDKYDIFTALTSNILGKKKGMHLDDVIVNIYNKGYKNILAKFIFICYGIECEKAINILNLYKNKFSNINFTYPLLYFHNDYINIKKFITDINITNNNSNSATLYVAHGTTYKNNSHYNYLYDMFKDCNILFCSIEHTRTIQDILPYIKKTYKYITIKPFLLASGTHIKKDISINIKNTLVKNNIFVTLDLTPLLEYKEIQNLLIDQNEVILL